MRSLPVDIAENAVFATTTKQAESIKIASLASAKKLSQYETPVLAQLKNVNVARYTEDVSWVYHVINNATYGNKTNELMTAIVDSKEVVLNRFVGKSFNCLLESKYTNASLNIFKTGEMYRQKEQIPKL